MTKHLIERWHKRISNKYNVGMIKQDIDRIIKYGTKIPIDRDHFKICYDGKCVIFVELSPLHCLAKTVYHNQEDGVAI